MLTEITEKAFAIDLHGVLDRVAKGEEVRVTRDAGPPVRLLPERPGPTPLSEAEFERVFQDLMALRKKVGPLGMDVAELRHEGHRY